MPRRTHAPPAGLGRLAATAYAQRLRRREVLQLLLGAPLAAQIIACERPGIDAPIPGALLGQDLRAGHRLRDHSLPAIAHFPSQPTHRLPVVIVGAGPAGLSAGYHLHRAGHKDFRVLDLEPVAGGTARGDNSAVTPYPWAAHYITCPSRDNRPLCDLLQEMGVVEMDGQGNPRGRDPYLVAEPKERHFYRGFFYPGLYRFAGASAEDRAQLQRFQRRTEGLARQRDGQGRRAFALPFAQSSSDVRFTQLDRLSAADYLRQEGLTSERLRWLADYACRDDFGLSLEDTSAWALLHYFAARSDPDSDTVGEVLTWPNGNAALVEHLSRNYSAAIFPGTMVVEVVQDDKGASVYAIDCANERLLHYRVQQVVVTTPQFITQRIVRELRDAENRPSPVSYGAWWVANVHLSDRPDQRGSAQAWDTVLTQSPSLGYVCATHQRGRGFGPTVLTYYMPMTDSVPAAGRTRLFSVGLKELQDVVMADLSQAHPDIRPLVQRIDVFRWGHAMAQPRVGELFAPARAQARMPRGRLHFAHSDLSSLALFEEAFEHGRRAAQEVARALEQEST